jgi:gliding motility-associated-like protein
MMLVNASFTPSDFYIDTVRNLCASTTYEFGAWVANVLLPSSCSPSPIHPKLVFNIETVAGQVLGTYSTGDILETGSPQWKQYGLFFTTPVNTSDVVIRLTNNAPGGCGNDLALDDITFRPCGPIISAGAANTNQKNFDFCTTNIAPINLSATVGSGFIAPSLQWQESTNNGLTWTDILGATTTSYLFNKTAVGSYQYRLSAAEGTNIFISNCRVASNPISITIHDIPLIAEQNNGPICENDLLQLSAGGGKTYNWTGPAGFTSPLPNPSFVAQTTASGQYNVLVTDSFGCSNTASTIVLVNPNPTAIVSANQNFCEGDTIQLTASGGTIYVWSPAAGLSDINIANPFAYPIQTTLYSVMISDANGCTDTDSVMLTIYKKPVAAAGADKVIIKGATVNLEGTAGGDNISYYWTPTDFLTDPLLLNTSSKPLQSIGYTLYVLSNKGCGTATDSMFIKVYNDLYIPSAFSPNNDGRNDTWRMEALSAFPNAIVSIYNRLGENVYTGKGAATIWDGNFKGNPLPAGSYVYVIDLKNGRPLLKGTVMLIR